MMANDWCACDWEWRGTPGHFIAARRCCFRLHTRVGEYRVSTIGCYHDDGQEPKTVGLGRLYETMVFHEKDGEVVDWGEMDADGYNDEDSATAGHLAMCAKWDERASA